MHNLTLAMEKDRKTVLAAAQNMIDRFGNDAITEVDLRITELQGQEQHDAQELWVEIRKAVKFLSGTPSKGIKE